MNNKLIPMTDFVLEQSKKYFDGHIVLNQYQQITEDYAKFLKQPLALWMFVPCDEEGNVLTDPCSHDRKCVDFCQGSCSQEYYEAQKRCLFEGFRIEEHEPGCYSVRNENDIVNVMWRFGLESWRPSKGLITVEGLTPYQMVLTSTALKQING